MIEVTDEMVRDYYRAATKQAGKVSKARHPAELEGSITRAGLAAVLAIVERDRCLAPAGHVWRPGVEDPPTCTSTVETRGEIVRCTKRPHVESDAHLGRSRAGWDVAW